MFSKIPFTFVSSTQFNDGTDNDVSEPVSDNEENEGDDENTANFEKSDVDHVESECRLGSLVESETVGGVAM